MKLLRAEEVAEKFQLTPRRIRKLARENLLPGAVRLGKQLRFRADAVEDFIASGGRPLPGGYRREPARG